MHTEDLLVDHSSDGETVEGVSEGLPQLDVVTTTTWRRGRGKGQGRGEGTRERDKERENRGKE